MAERGEVLITPSRADCLALMEAHGMLPHIREHSLLVTAVAVRLGMALVEGGFTLHLGLVEAGALLHDLGKTPCLGTAMNHADWGAQAVRAAGYEAVAQVVAEHVRLQPAPHEPRPLREAEVVNYADKRVLHTRVVSLGERFADLKARYGKTPAALSRIQLLEEQARGLEARLFAGLSLTPGDLLHLNHTRRKP